MAMTKTRVRRQSTLTFLAKQLVAVDQELGLLRRKAPAGGAAAATEAGPKKSATATKKTAVKKVAKKKAATATKKKAAPKSAKRVK